MDPFPARGAARRGGPEQWRRARASLVVLIPVAVALWALAGYASVSFLDTFRLMAVNDIGGWGEGTAGLAGGIMLFVGAVFAASFLGFAVGRRSTAAFATFKAGGLLSRAAAFGGVTVGLLVAWASDRWTRPTAVGRFVSEQDGDSDWGAPAWAAYHAPWLLPLVFGGVAVVCLLRFARSHDRERWAGTKAAEMKEHGVNMPGTITRVEFTGTWIMGDPQFAVTVSYVGKHGPRQATERFTASVVNAPVRGGQADVWYDPLGDEDVVLIELTESSSSYMVDPSR